MNNYVKLFESWLNEAEMSAEQMYKKQLDGLNSIRSKVAKMCKIEGAKLGDQIGQKINTLRKSTVEPAYGKDYNTVRDILVRTLEKEYNADWGKYSKSVDNYRSDRDSSSNENFRYDVMMKGNENVATGIAYNMITYELALILLYLAAKDSPELKKMPSSKLEPEVLSKKIMSDFRDVTETVYSIGINASVLSTPGYSYYDEYKAKNALESSAKKPLDKITYDDISIIVGFCAAKFQSTVSTMAKAVDLIAKKEDDPTIMNRVAGALQDLDNYMDNLRF